MTPLRPGAFLVVLLVGGLSMAALVIAQGPPGGRPGGGQHFRKHTAYRAQPLRLVPATENPPAASRHEFRDTPRGQAVSANGIPEHKVGRFPNENNPNTIQPQGYQIILPEDPQAAPSITPMNGPFGIALNGVFFDPGAAEYWQGDPSLGWRYEPLGGAIDLGLDASFAHVQPNGAYHYHGIPTLFVSQAGASTRQHSPLIGWAADGFPIYHLTGYSDPRNPKSSVKILTSSYQLKTGARPSAPNGPGGRYDGAFVEDYTYVEGSGDLDECNGRFCVTPEFPEGTYAYFLTQDWPVIPRNFRGTPVPLRKEPLGGQPGGGNNDRRPPGAGGEGGFPPPPGGGRPPRGPGGFPPPPPGRGPGF